MNDHQPPGSERAPGALRATALTAAVVSMLVLAAAAFALSYPGVHAVARQAGVSASMARVYPVIVDAMIVIAAAALLALRGAGLAIRSFAWLILLVLLAAAAGAGVLHATGNTIPHRPAAVTAAVLPWALVLIGFALLLTMLRHAGRRRGSQARAMKQPQPGRPAQAPEQANGLPASATGPDADLHSLLPKPLTSVRGEPRPASAPTTPWSTLPADPAPPSLPVRRPERQDAAAESGGSLVPRQRDHDPAADAADEATDPGLDDPTSDEATGYLPGAEEAGRDRQPAGPSPVTHTLQAQDPGPEPAGPVFHRIVSVPGSPDEGNDEHPA
jgi:Protein of unknown function (DUF2637)